MDKKFQDITHAIFNTMQLYLRSIGCEGISSYNDDYVSEYDYTTRKNVEGKAAENIVKQLTKQGFTKVALPEKEYPYKYKYEG